MRIAWFALCFLVLLAPSALAAGHDITKPVPEPSPLWTSVPQVATTGETFLAVWRNDSNLFGALFDADGKRITPGDLLILAGVSEAQLTAVGREYAVFWSGVTDSHLTFLGANATAERTVDIAIPPLFNVSAVSDGDQILLVGATGTFFPPSTIVGYLIRRDGSIAARQCRCGPSTLEACRSR